MIGALVIGLFGSLHCVGMCGPVMMTFMGAGQSRVSFLIYHVGRILTYVVIGIILGLIGASVALFHFQQVMVLILGILLLVFYGIPSLRHKLERWYYESKFYQLLKSFMTKNLSVRRRWFLSGVANGFFPCGLTYVAAAGAVALGSPVEGAIFMVLFGLGTLPSLIVINYAGNTIFTKVKNILPRSVTAIAIVSGLIMILRGLITTFPNFNHMVQANAAGLITVCGL